MAKKRGDRGLGGKRVVLGISGGIAAYKTPELVRLLVQAQAHVDVVMTPAAREFVSPLTLQVVSKNPVLEDLFGKAASKARSDVRHIAIADAADVALLAPATANVLARMASGIADDPVTTVFLALRVPILIAPAMNEAMWNHPATKEAVAKLERWGAALVGPDYGFLAEGYKGTGRMSSPEAIVSALVDLVNRRGPKTRTGRHKKGERPGLPPRRIRAGQSSRRIFIAAGSPVWPLYGGDLLFRPAADEITSALWAQTHAAGMDVTLLSANGEPASGIPNEGDGERLNPRAAAPLEVSEFLRRAEAHVRKADLVIWGAAVPLQPASAPGMRAAHALLSKAKTCLEIMRGLDLGPELGEPIKRPIEWPRLVVTPLPSKPSRGQNEAERIWRAVLSIPRFTKKDRRGAVSRRVIEAPAAAVAAEVLEALLDL